MNCFKVIVAGLVLQTLLCGYASARNESVEHKLTVTAVVQSSVALTVDGDGNPKLIVANAPARGDNVSRLEITSDHKSLVNPKTISGKNSGEKNGQMDQDSLGYVRAHGDVSTGSDRAERTNRN